MSDNNIIALINNLQYQGVLTMGLLGLRDLCTNNLLFSYGFTPQGGTKENRTQSVIYRL